MHVGVAGLGLMGSAIAQRLIEVGHRVSVWNRTSGKAKALVDAGASLAATPAALASAAEAIVTILTDAAAIDAVYGGSAGLLAGAVREKLFIDMSTVRPATAVRAGPTSACSAPFASTLTTTTPTGTSASITLRIACAQSPVAAYSATRHG